MLQHVFANTNDRIGLCLDTAWALDAGEDPLFLIEKFAKRLYGLHLKDFVFDRARKPQDVVVGTGNLDLKKISAALAQANFSGFAVLEYEGEPANPVPAVSQCVQAIKKIM
jgi:sugar phosphate isomerase/epimerase